MDVRFFVTDKLVTITTLLAIFIVIFTTILINSSLLPSFWLDELYSVTLAQQPHDRMIKTILADVHPPLYFIMLKIWASFGGYSEIYIRSMSALFAIVTVTSVYFMRKDLDRLTVFLFLLLILCNSMFLYYSQEARSNSLLLMLSTILTFLVYQYDKSNSRLGLIFIVGTLISLVHYFGILLAVVTYLILALEYRNKIVKLAQVFLFTLVACSWPMFHLLYGTLTHKMAGDFWVEVDGPLDTITIAACASVSAVCAASRVVPTYLIGGLLVLFIGMAFLRWFPLRNLGEERYTGPFRLWMIITLYISCLMIIDLITPVSTVRNFIGLLPPVYLLVAHFISRVLKNDTKMAKAVLVVFTVFILLQIAHGGKSMYKKAQNFENWFYVASSALASTRESENIFYYAPPDSELGHQTASSPDREHLVYNFYIENISKGEKEALPLKLDQVNETELPYVFIFCHIGEDLFGRIFSELEGNFSVKTVFFQINTRDRRVCGVLHVQN